MSALASVLESLPPARLLSPALGDSLPLTLAHPLPPTPGRLLGSWSFDPILSAVLAFAGAAYLYGMTRTSRRWPLWRALSWLLGLGTLALALMSGIDYYGDNLLLSVHMAQHMLLLLIAPILLLYGAPVRLALAALTGSRRRAPAEVLRSRPVHLLSRPAVGFAVYAAVVLGTHLTGLYELALRHETVHALEHAAYFWSGVLLLAPLIAADPLPRPPQALARFSWLMGAMVVMAVPGVLLTFAHTVRYPYYLAPARELGRSALADQQSAGVIMWVGGGIVVFTLAMVVAMGAMIAEERRQQRREAHETPALFPGPGSPAGSPAPADPVASAQPGAAVQPVAITTLAGRVGR